MTSGTASAGVDAGLELGWTYDRYGNRWAQNATCTSGSCGGISAVQPQLTFANSNQVVGWSYDADGNLLYDGRNTYAYDAEGRLITLNGEPTYLYDAEGRRVAKYSGSMITSFYLLGLGGEQVTELTGSGAWKHSNVYAGGRLLATYEGPAGTAAVGYHFHFTDWLGTNRVQTNASGNSEETCTSYPFGDGLNCSGTAADATEQHFTGKERDVESGLDYFFARYYSSDLARFMTPDWAAKPTDVPYAQFGDPQTLNLYAYVNNNPNTGIDLDGHLGGNNMDSVTGFLNGSGNFDLGPPDQGGSNNGSNGSNGTSPSNTTVEVAQNTGTNTPGVAAQPAPSNPSPNNPVQNQAQPGQNATSNNPQVSSNNTSGSATAAAGSAAGSSAVAAPSNGPTWSQKNQNCLNQINNTPDGKVYNTFSYISSLIGPDASRVAVEQDAASEAAQRGGQSFLSAAAKNWGGTALGSGSGFVGGVWEAVDGFALTPLAVAATVGQLTVHAGCAISAAF